MIKRGVTLIKQIIAKYYNYIPKTVLKRFFTPRNLVVEPVAGCNVRCSACPQDQLQRPYGKMNYDDFRKVIIKTHPVSVGLYFMGEPFLNRQIFDMIAYAKHKGVKTVVNTNSTLLLMDHALIMDSGLNKITLSLDGVTQETMEKYRHGINAENVLKGIKLLSTYNTPKPHIQVRTLMFKPTIEELPQIKEFLASCGITDHRLITPIITGWGGKQNPDIDILGEGRSKSGKPKICPSLFRMAITWDGWVLPCCNDVHGKYRFGNIFTDNYMDIMWGSGMWKLKAKRVFSICENCTEDEES